MRYRHISLGLAAAVGAALTATAAPADPPRLPSAAPNLDKVAGVYKHRFANADVQGDQFTSEDVFELVKVSATTAYFRIHGEFFNGHMCDLWGVADLEPKALVYHGPRDSQGNPCVLAFTVNKDGIILEDVGGFCRNQSCGARGGYGYGAAVDYPFKSRRAIRYMPLLLRSSEYASAVKEHAAHPVGTPAPAP